MVKNKLNCEHENFAVVKDTNGRVMFCLCCKCKRIVRLLPNPNCDLKPFIPESQRLGSMV